ncbi:hypothetical protein Mycch_5136 [Mycolicibacterium chubuense NBB4]|uniref:DUF5666 domain-containing protein n=1 Tax=Mycolicibacterium chubuense (strain NBB4) TaxID=710421 RepID=I4BRB5_MYCCN|nr:hypothetical protein [Mycolicibacterium chubuense]AFM19822.1 hypothetical protein Mycch_5136 [Mycolicibacterium chubuense NBB4]
MTTTHAGRHRLPGRVAPTGRGLVTVSMFAAAAAAGWALAVSGGAPHTASVQPHSAAASAPAPAVQQIQRQGQVVAVSRDSLTTASADGQVMTFRITSDTTQITGPGTVATPYAATSFAPRQNVVVVGVVRDGTPVATAIADQHVTAGRGAPMDYGLPT